MNRTERYCIAVASKDHIKRGVEGGFMQASHGKAGPLKKLHVNDWVIFYSPKTSCQGDEKLQAFTAIGRVAGQGVYPEQIAGNLIPYRRDIQFYPCKEVSFVPLISQWNSLKTKSHGAINSVLDFLK